MQLTMLGTGNAMVTKCYNTCFAFRSGAGHYLVDAGGGNGILRQLELAWQFMKRFSRGKDGSLHIDP